MVDCREVLEGGLLIQLEGNIHQSIWFLTINLIDRATVTWIWVNFCVKTQTKQFSNSLWIGSKCDGLISQMKG